MQKSFFLQWQIAVRVRRSAELEQSLRALAHLTLERYAGRPAPQTSLDRNRGPKSEIDLAVCSIRADLPEAALALAAIVSCPSGLARQCLQDEDPGLLLIVAQCARLSWATVRKMLNFHELAGEDALFVQQCCEDFHSIRESDAAHFMAILKEELEGIALAA